MAREKRTTSPSNTGGIPKWFVTYSDVITLLMTFFILLLTFANSEPEKFDQMRVALFGAGGSSGIVGKIDPALDESTVVRRERPPSARLTMRGSEIPPMYTDPISEAVGKGLESLEHENDLAKQRVFALEISKALFWDSSGHLTETAQQHLKMLASQMKQLPLSLTIIVGNVKDLTVASNIANYLATELLVPYGRVSVGVADGSNLPSKGLRFVIRHDI